MMTNHKMHIIINPASAGGKTRLRQSEILNILTKKLGNHYSLYLTRKPLDASASTTEALRNGCELIIAIGGDGTIQEVVNGFFSTGRPVNPDCQLGIISSGTGHGFAQSLGLPKGIADQIDVIGSGLTRRVDVGNVSYQNEKREIAHRYFINECQLGIGGAVVQRVQQNHKKFGGLLAFGIGTIETAFHHPNQVMKISADHQEPYTTDLTGILIANGAYMGGGMNLAPGAKVDDGLFNILVMLRQTVFQRLQNFPKIYTGNHIHSPAFGYFQAKTVTIESEENVLVEADGELLGTTRCKVEILPAALPVRFSS
jgi:YegS/Rv2252/BmrU family lipid kinase